MLANGSGSLELRVSSSARTRLLELFEIQGDQGPCLDSYRLGERVIGDDLAEHGASQRWPQFAAEALGNGYASVYAFPLRWRNHATYHTDHAEAPLPGTRCGIARESWTCPPRPVTARSRPAEASPVLWGSPRPARGSPGPWAQARTVAVSDRTPQALGERGLQRALARLEADLGHGRCPLVSLAEVLGWLDGLARWHRDALGPRTFDTRRDDDHDGRALAGVRYANATIEGSAVRVGEVAKFGGPGPEPMGLTQLSGALSGRAWRWRRTEALSPPPPDEAGDPEAGRYYDSRVAKRPLAEPLREAARFLTGTVAQDAAVS